MSFTHKKDINMDKFITIIAINTIFSIIICYYVGSSWKDVISIGTKLEKILLWVGFLQSGVGFSIPMIFFLGYIDYNYLSAPKSLVEIEYLTSEIISFSDKMILLPTLNAITIAKIYFVKNFYKKQKFADLSTTLWITFNNTENINSLFDNFGNFIEEVIDIFKNFFSDKNDICSKISLFFVSFLTFLLLSGFIIAFLLTRFFSIHCISRIDEYFKYKNA